MQEMHCEGVEAGRAMAAGGRESRSKSNSGRSGWSARAAQAWPALASKRRGRIRGAPKGRNRSEEVVRRLSSQADAATRESQAGEEAPNTRATIESESESESRAGRRSRSWIPPRSRRDRRARYYTRIETQNATKGARRRQHSSAETRKVMKLLSTSASSTLASGRDSKQESRVQRLLC